MINRQFCKSKSIKIALATIVFLLGAFLTWLLLGFAFCPGISMVPRWTRMVAPSSMQLEPSYVGTSFTYQAGNESFVLGAGQVVDIATSSDSGSLAIATGNQVRVFLTNDFKELWDISNREGIQQILFSPDGKFIAVAMLDGTIRVLRADSGSVILALDGANAPIQGISWSSDSSMIAATTSSRREFFVWNLNANGHLRRIQVTGSRRIGVVAWSTNNSQVVATGWENDITLWNVNEGIELRSFATSRLGNVTALSWLPHSSLLAVGGANIIEILDTDNGRLVETLGVDITQTIDTLNFSSDGEWLAAASSTLNFRQDGSVVDSSTVFLWRKRERDR